MYFDGLGICLSLTKFQAISLNNEYVIGNV